MTTANRSRTAPSTATFWLAAARSDWRSDCRSGWATGLVWLLGCGGAQLVPLQPTSGKEALVVSAGIEVRADAEQHLASVPSSFIPLRITVRNTGATPIYIALDDIDLAGPDRELDAVPPASIPAHLRIASLGMDPGSPFLVQQTTSGSGPRTGGRIESVLLEPGLGRLPGWSPARERVRLEISTSAFQGGVIGAGETRRGFVYFRTVPRDGERLTLRVGVRSSPLGAPASVVEIPYGMRG
jgi:hypothetical protein